VLIVHYAVKAGPAAATAPSVRLERKLLDPAEPIPPGAVWIAMVEPTPDEDRKVEGYLGCKVPSRSDPDFAEPAESYYTEDGVRYLHASVVSEAENTPDVAGVTFVLGPKALVTVRYDPGEAFEFFGQRLGKIPAQALHPDAVAVGLINAIADRSARALNKVGVELDSIASRVFRAKGDQSARSRIYSATLDALGREDEKISNLRESLVEIERLLLFLLSEGRSADARSQCARRRSQLCATSSRSSRTRASKRRKRSSCSTPPSASSTSRKTRSSSCSRCWRSSSCRRPSSPRSTA
jgi:magnesium transporter